MTSPSKSLVEEIRKALERQNEEVSFEYDDCQLNEDVELAFRKGADSRTEIILKLVAALDQIASEDFRGNRPSGSVKAYHALTDLKKSLGLI